MLDGLEDCLDSDHSKLHLLDRYDLFKKRICKLQHEILQKQVYPFLVYANMYKILKLYRDSL